MARTKYTLGLDASVWVREGREADVTYLVSGEREDLGVSHVIRIWDKASRKQKRSEDDRKKKNEDFGA